MGKGLLFSIAFLLLGLVLDLSTIRERPFMWIRKMSEFTWWRILLVNMAGIIGA